MNPMNLTENSNATHTPGPWTAQRDCRGGYGNALGEAWGIYGPETRIAVMETAQDWRPQEVIDANARLIAAAPELLDALKGLQLVAEYIDTTEAMSMRALFPNRFSAMDAAIARATNP